MKIEIVIDGINVDISSYIESISWSGDRNQMARKLSFSYLYPDGDAGIQRVDVVLGTRILFYCDSGALLFDGICITLDRTETDIKISVSAADYAWYLKSKVFGTYSGTPEQIVRSVLQENGISCGKAVSHPVTTKVVSTGDKNIHEVLTAAYADSGHKIYVYMEGTSVCTGIFGEKPCGVVTGNDYVLDAKYRSSIENMVNKVAVIDKKAGIKTSVQSDGDITRFGTIQEVYTSEGKKNDLEEARKILKGIENSGSVTVRGNTAFQTGKSIIVEQAGSFIRGNFHIVSDSHSIRNGSHTVTLSLEFEGVVE